MGVVIGEGLALRGSAGRIGTGNGRMRAIVALVAGLIASVNGGAEFGHRHSNESRHRQRGNRRGAAALVLGLIAMVLGVGALWPDPVATAAMV